ncbi:MAG: endo-1,4-beta-xylanase [Brevundimonas sp.]|uniref:endo-1,4-beta-xylanase n=1 Tax=Brevundimonas sp. TaxID=1871086 RepID=UPI00273320F2|nr:endo-1,4-beta-xylanase [Brevundimonas sp.]MDP3404176.1 endo-1,4-beta-xylanase [Brevundimonas sp.]
MIDRRALLATGAAALAVPALAGTPLQGQAPASLHALASAKGLLFGSAIPATPVMRRGSAEADAYLAVIAAECGALVCENEMKWPALRPNATDFTFAQADAIVDYAAAHDMKMRGHTLLWHHPQWFPDWLTNHDFGSRPASEAERILTRHIRRVCAQYPQVVSWDVINEAVDADTGALRDTSLSKAMGHAVLDVAFHTAREAAPNAQLIYNDYMSWEAGHERHRAGVMRLLEGFRARGVPIDGLGVQSHIGSGNADNSVGFDTAQETEWSRFIDEAVGMGLKLEITEFDVHDKNLPAEPVVRDREVAALGRRYLDLMLDYPQLHTVMAWGMTDRYTWLQGRWPREDGLPKRPTPYDADFRAKPLRQAMADAFQAAAPRPPLV